MQTSIQKVNLFCLIKICLFADLKKIEKKKQTSIINVNLINGKNA